MPPVTADQLSKLEPYIAGARSDHRGELEMYCPLHPDRRRSASINVEKGVWYCHAGCGGGSVRHLILAADSWVPADGRVEYDRSPAEPVGNNHYIPTIDEVEHWHKRIRRDDGARKKLADRRGLDRQTLRQALIGWNGKVYKIPVFGPGRRLWNVRNYDFHPQNGHSKMWNTKGMGSPPRLYPYGVLERTHINDTVLFCEGEWDALLALQHGQRAITTTAGAGKPWHDEWTEHFVGLKVYLCHDVDTAGDRSDNIVFDALSDVAEVFQCALPFRPVEKGGSDLTDYLLMFSPETRNDMLQDLVNSAEQRTIV